MQRATDASITRLVTDWTNRMSAIARNLVDFNESENARRMRARLENGNRCYRGATAARAREAVDALDGLWRDYLLVSRVVDEAAALARKSGLLSNTDDAVRALLEGPSIEMPAISVPVSRRGLLDGAERITRARPDEVLDSMLNAFAKARDTVTAIADAEATTTRRVGALADEARALRDWAEANDATVGTVETASLDLAEADGDPLAASAWVSQAEGTIVAARAIRLAIETRIATLRQGLDSAPARLQSLHALLARVDVAEKENAATFGGASSVVPDDPVPALEGWLRTISETAGPRWKAAAVGLAAWDKAVTVAYDVATRSYDRVRTPLDAYENIRGRFRALRVKGASTTARDPEMLARLEAGASESLTRRPLDLNEAKRSVEAFEAALAAEHLASATRNGRP